MTQMDNPPRQTLATSIRDYIPLVGAGEIDELYALAEGLKGRRVQFVNSTAVGGGVAEILSRFVPLAGELGVDIRWDVITGGIEFFEVTKAFHNALQGGAYNSRPEDFEIFRAHNELNRARMRMDGDFIVIHDPQPAGLIESRKNHSARWVWRCHIDLSQPNETVWNFLRTYVERYDAGIFSAPQFTRQLAAPQFLFYPPIDPLSDKNRELEPKEIEGVLEKFGIDPNRPILTQISRFDRWKDPIGVIRAYRIVRRYFDCQLVLAGGGATDDPEGAAVLAEVLGATDGDPDIHVLDLPPRSPVEINALQRSSTVIIQKSLREGFGLTVAEALWKRKAVVASAVGGIPSQVIHKHTGLLAHSVEGTAYQIRYLLSHPALAKKLGENGHEHVHEEFLVTTNLKRYLTLFSHLQAAN
jgi:trehalose synthase